MKYEFLSPLKSHRHLGKSYCKRDISITNELKLGKNYLARKNYLV